MIWGLENAILPANSVGEVHSSVPRPFRLPFLVISTKKNGVFSDFEVRIEEKYGKLMNEDLRVNSL